MSWSAEFSLDAAFGVLTVGCRQCALLQLGCGSAQFESGPCLWQAKQERVDGLGGSEICGVDG